MADPDFAACFGRVVVEHAQMLRQERQVIFTLRSSAPLDKGPGCWPRWHRITRASSSASTIFSVMRRWMKPVCGK